MLKQKKKLYSLAILIPLIIGTIGYYIEKDKITDCLYASFALYFTNPISDAYNILIEVARWTAPLATATVLLSMIHTVWTGITWWINGLSKKSVAVYTDSDRKITFSDDIKVAYPGEYFKSYFENQIILFSNDEKNLLFYEENKEKLIGKSVYIGINDIEQGILDTKKTQSVTLFDINRSIARVLWKNIALWEWENVNPNIVIYGNGSLACQILSTGLQLNLFSLTQGIHYYFVSEDNSYRIRHGDIELMNDDEIAFVNPNDEDIWKIIGTADIVILADIPKCTFFQNVAVKADGKIYYYSPQKGDIGEQIAIGDIVPFGRNEDIFTDENVRNGGLINRAKSINDKYAKYAKNSPEVRMEWDELSGFLKESNISFADYMEVLSALIDKVPDGELAELEHIRWCRFHYLNYWKYSEVKNDSKRYHNDLKLYKELSPEEQAKDMVFVKEAREYKKQKCLS